MTNRCLNLVLLGLSVFITSCLNQQATGPSDNSEATLIEPNLILREVDVTYENGDKGTFQYLEGEDHVVIEGDMIFPKSFFENPGGLSKAASRGNIDLVNRWKDGVVPYEIYTTNPDIRADIAEAIEDYHSKTGIRFIPRKSFHSNYLVFRDGPGCQSQIGAQGGRQYIYLTPYCGTKGIIHELGHTMGLLHEHQRVDRDEWVSISGKWYLDYINWVKRGVAFWDYDVNSVMHYGMGVLPIQDANGNWLDIQMTARQTPINPSNRLSPGDVRTLAFLYPDKNSLQLDANHDGITDALYLISGKLTLAHGRNTPGYITPVVINTNFTNYPIRYFKKGDFNGDGMDDLIMIVPNSNRVKIFWGNSAGSFNISTFTPWSGYAIQDYQDFLVGDFNNDNRDDLIHFVRGADYVWMWNGRSDKKFDFVHFKPRAGYPLNGANMIVHDFDRDGYSDIVDIKGGAWASIWRNRKNGTFWVYNWRMYPKPQSIGSKFKVGDFNGDGWTDLLDPARATTWLGHRYYYYGFDEE